MIYKRQLRGHMDVTVNGIRYREALETTDRRVALNLENKRVGEIQAGKRASKTGRDFAREPFSEAVKVYLEERKPHVSARTVQFEQERLKPLEAHFGEKSLVRIKPEDISAYQRDRLKRVAPRMSRRMLEHYSHVRMDAKRTALDKLESGLMTPAKADQAQAAGGPVQ